MAIIRIREEREKVEPGATVEAPAEWDVGTFAQKDIDRAVDLVVQLAKYGFPATPNLIPAFWPVPSAVPGIEDLDFGHVTQMSVALSHLKASQSWLRADRLIWHLQNPGDRLNNNPFTSMPLVILTADDGPVIVDGHHSLGALLLLGSKNVPVWSLPTPNQPQE